MISNSRDHNEKKPYKCRICDKGFKAKMSLSTIIVGHTKMLNYFNLKLIYKKI